MEDTIVLEFNLGDPVPATIIDPTSYSSWNPPLHIIINERYLGPKYSLISHCFPTDPERKSSIYMPRLTFQRRLSNCKYCNYLYVEFSISKLCFGNNFYEFRQKHFPIAVSRLETALHNKGIQITSSEIRIAIVRKIHYSINCKMPSSHDVESAIKYLELTNIPKTRHSSRKHYSMGGDSFYISTNNKSVLLYNKIQELINAKKSELGNFESENFCQFDLLKKLENAKYGILRFEVRYTNKYTIRKELSKIGFHFKGQPSFEQLIDDKIAKEVLKHEYLDILKRIPKFAGHGESLLDYVSTIRNSNPNISLSTLAKVATIHTLLQENDMQTIRNILCKNNQQWYELNKLLSKLTYPRTTHNPLSILGKRLDGL